MIHRHRYEDDPPKPAPEPMTKEQQEALKINQTTLRTIHTNLEIMVTNEKEKTKSRTDFYNPWDNPSSTYLKTSFGDDGNLRLKTWATVTADGFTESGSSISIHTDGTNIHWGEGHTYTEIELPIHEPNGYHVLSFLRDSTPTPADNKITPRIHMLVSGWRPIVAFLQNKRAWTHHVVDNIEDTNIGSSSFKLTVESSGYVQRRRFAVTGDAECKLFTVTYQSTTETNLDIQKLQEEIRKYIHTPQNGFFARYTELTERADVLMRRI
jgi:hypothetical protein